ncbi:hypothetical protein IFM89_011374 [Coptis chinensis]|uniref:MORF/ORRM1/DAG-like MORF domain-containing protein n=1 Tax=Coptis chinensis TaxID=261450 RepID=A0A835HPH5_9MAGN|nr:hypothetical protein IFM89_011374 [Coptis chinensis]
MYARTNGLEFGSEKALFDYYVKLLSEVVGSEEARKKIYCVSRDWSHLGFCSQIDVVVTEKLKDFPVFYNVIEDMYFHIREKTTAVAESNNIFSPLNQNQSLLNIFSYYHCSKPKLEWDLDHWLANIKCPEGGFATRTEALGCCIEV